MNFEISKLPYGVQALEPFISSRTIAYHYGKHHQAYLTNLNNLIRGTKYENSDLENIIKNAEGPLFNNAAQVWNHTFYFEGLKPVNEYGIQKSFSDALKGSFGSLTGFKESFIKAGVSLFGSGWVWLVKNPVGSLEILQESNAGNPLLKNLKPLLTCDVWEHSYYLDYQNKRMDYLNAFWNIIDWETIEKRYFS